MNDTDRVNDTDSNTEKRAPARRTAPRWLLYVGLVLFAVGAVFIVIGSVVPYVNDGEAPGWYFGVAMTATPIGFLLALAYGIFGALPPRGKR